MEAPLSLTLCDVLATDFVKDDVKKNYAALLPYVSITIVEAGPALLGPFDKALQDYARGLFQKRDIDVRLGTAVIGIETFEGENYRFPGQRAMLSNGESLEYGTMVWSAGLAPRRFTEALDEHEIARHPRTKRILVDDYLRVPGKEGSIWALGDAAINAEGIPMPQLAQVARQQGIYLAKVLNGKQKDDAEPFSFFSLGSMAFMGDLKGIYDGSSAGPLRDPSVSSSALTRFPALKGFLALMLWRFAYWGRQTSIANKIMIPVHWAKTYFFGRDISRY